MSNLAGFKKTLEYLVDGNEATSFYLLAVIEQYKRWPDILNWLVVNEIRGRKLIEFFQNESDRERGILVAVNKIINRLECSIRPLNGTDLRK